MDNSTNLEAFYADNVGFFIEWRKNDTSMEKLQNFFIWAGFFVSLFGIIGKN